MPAGAVIQVSRSPAQGPGYQLKSSLASELLSVYLSHIICILVCLILLSVLEVCGQPVYMGPIGNSVYAIWILFDTRLATCLFILFIRYVMFIRRQDRSGDLVGPQHIFYVMIFSVGPLLFSISGG